MRNRWFVPAGLAGVALAAAACGTSSTANSGSSPSAAAASSASLKTTTIGGAKVLTNAKGFTVYWFGPDTASKSNCNGSCAHYWPPVKGPVTAGTGVTGTVATITRSDGSVQATYNGHPLYTYVSDSAPGQAKGTGAAASTSSGGGGY
jgi:predicted lipoprotein with Yx(FWY)xxD motif